MNKVILLLLIGFFVTISKELHAQNDCCAAPALKPKIKFTSPIFLDSAAFEKDLIKSKILDRIYFNLKASNSEMMYECWFDVKRTGIINALKTPNESVFNSLSKYFNTTFKKYKWSASHKINCKSCRIDTPVVVYVYFNTSDGNILISFETINVLVSRHVYRKRIMMK